MAKNSLTHLYYLLAQKLNKISFVETYIAILGRILRLKS